MNTVICRKCSHVHDSSERMPDKEYPLLKNCPNCWAKDKEKRSPYYKCDDQAAHQSKDKNYANHG